MSNLKKERLNQMIDNALSYEQELRSFELTQIYKRFKVFILKPKVYGLTFASFIISCVFIYPIVTSRNLVDIYEINEYVTFSLIEDL
tara:strand:- start:36 stop:296 length:261 start_codon:yes stop_codon:yes gene_type:complete